MLVSGLRFWSPCWTTPQKIYGKASWDPYLILNKAFGKYRTVAPFLLAQETTTLMCQWYFIPVKMVGAKVNKSSKWPSTGCWINPMEETLKKPRESILWTNSSKYLGIPNIIGERKSPFPCPAWLLGIILSTTKKQIEGHPVHSWFNPPRDRSWLAYFSYILIDKLNKYSTTSR